MSKFVLCLGLLAGFSSGCGDDSSALGDSGTRMDGSAPDPIPTAFCAGYEAQCPIAFDEAMCASDCEVNTDPDLEDCGFWACGVEVGLCDNEVEGDPEILACMERHGWLD